MGKGDKKSRKGKIIMGTYGVNRPKKKRHNYRFVPRPKKESLLGATESDAASAIAAEKAKAPKKKTAAKTSKEKTAKK